MIEPAIPANEPERLESLRRMCLLDTPAEGRFDRLTRLAQRHFDVPFAMVTLVDEHRQWFKSIVGANLSETPRSISFCAHTILDEAALIVPDATRDARFSANPVVTGDLHVRFYAGVPVCSLEGFRVGTFCLVGTEPREFHPEELAYLEDFAACAETELQVVKLTRSEIDLLEQMDELSRRAATDPLTRSWTGATILQLLEEHWRRSRPLSAIVLELDQAPGDEVLRGVADRIRSVVRAPNAFGRIAENRFLVVLPGAPQVVAQAVAERLRRVIRSRPIRHGPALVQITASIGLAGLPPCELTSAAHLHLEAEEAMRAAQANGRDRITTPSDSPHVN